MRTLLRSIAITALVSACTGFITDSVQAEPRVDGHAIANEAQGSNWLSYGRTYSENFFSPLSGITDKNIKRLGLAWYLDLPGQRTLEGIPLAVDGVLYFSGTYGKTFAVDAKSGRLLWQFDAESGHYRPDIFRYSGSLGGHRGVAYWRGKVYVGVIDGRLFALDSRTGKPLWSVQTFDDPKGRKVISGAPRVFNDKVIIGQNGDPGARGYVSAYDTETGRLSWRFYLVPGDPSKGFENEAMAMAAKTWTGKWWVSGGNASVWDSIVYDPKFNRIYLGTANSIAESATARSTGDNLFVSSIVALDADTGRYLWHYQENPRGEWDYDSNMSMALAELTINGTRHDVLLHAPKNGFFYVLDRAYGELISAEKFTKVTWAERIDLKSGRPVENPNVAELWPSFLGAHSWQPMSFSPATNLAYIPTLELGQRLDTPKFTPLKPENGHTAKLVAWDPVRQTKRWEQPYVDSFWNGGVMSTGGNLVFQGTARGELIAYRATTGEKLWAFEAGLGIVGTPMTYEVEGRQYLSVLAGYGGAVGLIGKVFDPGWRFNEQPRRLLTFALGAQARLPPGNPPRHDVKAMDDPLRVIEVKQASEGAELYRSASCSLCHGPEVENTGSFAPDLRESALAMSWEGFQAVVRGGAMAALGMPKFEDLSEQQAHAIYMYIRQRAREAKQPAH